MTSIAYLDLADFLAIAELVLGTPAEELAAHGRIELAASALAAPAAAFGDVEPYPTIPLKAAVLCTRIVKNHPLLDGNKRSDSSAWLSSASATATPRRRLPETRTAKRALRSSST